MKNLECDGAPALPLWVCGLCSTQEGLGRSSVLLGSPQSQGVSAATCVAVLGLRDRPHTHRGPYCKCPTSIGGLGWDPGLRGQPGHFISSTQDSLSRRRQVINHFPLSLKTVLLASTWLNGGLSDSHSGGHIPGLTRRPSSHLHLHASPTASVHPPLPLPTPKHAAAFLSPSLGRTNGLIQGHPARSVSLRQSCAQLCVKNDSQPLSEQAGLVGANCRGFVNTCWLP